MFSRQYLRFTFINLMFAFGIGLLAPILGPYIKGIGLTNTQTSMIFSALPLAIIFFVPILGHISDKIGRNRIIKLALMTETLALVLYLIDRYVIFIFIARLLSAVAASALPLIALAKIEDGIKNDRGRLSGIFLSIKYIGSLIAPLAGGFLADFFFIRFPFIVAIVINILLFIALLKDKEKKKATISFRDFNVLEDIKKFLAHRDLKAMALLGMCSHAVGPFPVLFLPLFITEDLGLSASYVGLALFVAGLTHLFQGFFGRWADKVGNAKAVIIGLILNASMLCLFFTIKSYTALLVLLFIRGTGLAIWNVSAWTLMSDIGEKMKEEGLIVTSYLSLAKIGALVSFLISGIIVDMYSIMHLVLIYGIIVFAACLISLFIFSKRYMANQ